MSIDFEKELCDYISYYFATEESWTKILNYLSLAKFVHEHQEAIRQVNKFIIEYMRGSKSIPYEVLRFLSH